MKAAVKVSEAISRLRRQIDTTELEEAVDDFLAAYGELRSQYYYEDSEAKANAKTASTLLEAVDRGLIELPQTDDGIVIVPDMKLRLPRWGEALRQLNRNRIDRDRPRPDSPLRGWLVYPLSSRLGRADCPNALEEEQNDN